MDFLKDLFHFFVDPSHKFSKRALIALLTIGLLIFVDRSFKLSDNYITTQKLDQVEKIEKLIGDEKIDPEVKKKLKTIEISVLERQTVWNSITDVYLYLKEFVVRPEVPTKVNNKDSERIIPVERTFFWQSFSSAWIIYFIMIAGLTIPFQEKRFDISYISGIILVELFLFAIVFGFSSLFALIPIIGNNPNYNYILNAVIHLLIFILLGVFAYKADKSKKSV